MAIQSLTDLRIQVNNDIKTNGVRAITGNIMNVNLIDMIDSLEEDYDNLTTSLDVRLTAIENLALKILQDPLTGWDASSGTFPGGGATKVGYYWNVSVAGTVDGVFFDMGDSIVSLVDNASTTVYSGNWFKEDNIDQVLSVAGKTGEVTLVAADITDFSTAVGSNAAVAANTAKVSNVDTNLSEGSSTTTTVNVNSSDGLNATLTSATTVRAGLMSKAKFDEVTVNTLKTSNVTHTGEVTGATALTVSSTAISNKSALGALVGTEEFLINDAGTLKKVLAANVGGNLGNQDLTLTANRTVTMGTFGLAFQGNQTLFKGVGTIFTTASIVAQNSGGNQTLRVGDDGTSQFNSQGSVYAVDIRAQSNGFANTNRGLRVGGSSPAITHLETNNTGVGIFTTAQTGCSLTVQGNSGGAVAKIFEVKSAGLVNIFRVGNSQKTAIGPTATLKLDLANVTLAAFVNIEKSTATVPAVNFGTGATTALTLDGDMYKDATAFTFANGSDLIKLYAQDNTVGSAALVGGGGTAITDTDTFGGFTLQKMAQVFLNNGFLK